MWLIVRVSPVPPKMTSWRASSPSSRRLCTGTLETCWPRARWSMCGADTGPRPALARPISSAVRTAVPDGESTLPAWCASTISIESKNRATMAESAVPMTEPMEKLGMMTTPVSSRPAMRRARASIRSCDQPEVPTSTRSPWSTAKSTTPWLARGTVRSITTSAPSISARSLAEFSPATRS